jgi:hypothetical protein
MSLLLQASRSAERCTASNVNTVLCGAAAAYAAFAGSGLEEGSVKMVSCLTNSREEHMITLPDDESEEGSSDEEEGSGDGSEGAASSEGGEEAAGSEEAGAVEHTQEAAGEQGEAEVSTSEGHRVGRHC